jgi:hypothetical protein
MPAIHCVWKEKCSLSGMNEDKIICNPRLKMKHFLQLATAKALIQKIYPSSLVPCKHICDEVVPRSSSSFALGLLQIINDSTAVVA